MKIQIIDNPNALKFENVEVRKPLAADVISAQMMSDETREVMGLFLALMSICCTFDGKKMQYEDLKNMDGWDFFELLQAISPSTAQALAKHLSASQKNSESQSVKSNK